MKIDMHNYEEFFLLYIDNELSASQKAAVELFVQENPIYQKELDLLQKTKLAPAQILFEDKISLYRFEEMEASLPNDFKQSLYRKEVPIVKAFFNTQGLRAFSAMAAILLLIIGYQFIHNEALKTDKIGIAQKGNNTENFTTTQSAISNTAEANYSKQSQVTPIAIADDMPKQAPLEMHTTKAGLISQMKQVSTTSENPPTAITSIKNPIVMENNLHSNNAAVATTPTYLNKTVTEAITTETAAVEASERYEEVSTENPDRVIYIANLEIDGDKLRGLTRRVNALFKRNKTEKEK